MSDKDNAVQFGNEETLNREYFQKKLETIIRDLNMYTPSELARELIRLGRASDREVFYEPEFSGHQTDFELAFALTAGELNKAVAKFPTWPTDPLHALTVLGEEYGELNKETLQLTYEPEKTNFKAFKKEAIQTAAMSIRFLASIRSYEFKASVQHEQNNREKEYQK